MQLSYYLFNASVKSLADVWQNNVPPGPPSNYQPVALKKPFSQWAEAYVLANKRSTPPWVDFVRPICTDAALDKIRNVSSSFILLIKVQKRVFAVCFGHGYTIVDQELLQADFGLWVTANSIANDKIVAIQARNIDPVTFSSTSW